MTDGDDRLLDLALEELHGDRNGQEEAALRRIEGRLTEEARSPRGSSLKVAAIAASVISLSLVSWFLVGRPVPAPERLPGRQEDPADLEIRRLIEQLSDPDVAARDQASAALKGKGPDLLERLRLEQGRARDEETRARLGELVAFWTRMVAARVDADVITWDQIDAKLKDVRPSDITPELRRSMLQALVEERAFLREARRRGIGVAEPELLDAARRNGTPEEGLQRLRDELSIRKLYDRILEDVRSGVNPYGLELRETPRDELRRWYDANPDKFVGLDRVDACWVEFRVENEQDRLKKKKLADALARCVNGKKSLGAACSELGLETTIRFSVFDRSAPNPGPFGDATRKELLDGFAVGEARVVENPGASIYVVQMYGRQKHEADSFEQAEPAIRAMFENRRVEGNRKRMRDGILHRVRIIPRDLFENP